MPESLNMPAPVRRLSPGHGHYFFGYYDIPAADAAGRHLAHRVAFRDRLPAPGDTAQLGWLPFAQDGKACSGFEVRRLHAIVQSP